MFLLEVEFKRDGYHHIYIDMHILNRDCNRINYSKNGAEDACKIGTKYS